MSINLRSDPSNDGPPDWFRLPVGAFRRSSLRSQARRLAGLLVWALFRRAARQQSEELFLLVFAGRHRAWPRRGAFNQGDGRARHCDICCRPSQSIRHRPLGRRRHGFCYACNVSGGFCRRRHHRGAALWMRQQCSTSIRGHVLGARTCPAGAWRSRAGSVRTSRAMAENLGLAWHQRSDRKARQR
jgi:hypothetical protein